ncbi:hypothetical protein Tco_1195572 [Tanacetum coccineum]
MQVNVQFLQQLQQEWSRFVTVVKQREEIDTVCPFISVSFILCNPLALLGLFQPISDNFIQAPNLIVRSNAPSYMHFLFHTTKCGTTRHSKGKRSKPVVMSFNLSPFLRKTVDPEQARGIRICKRNLALLAVGFSATNGYSALTARDLDPLCQGMLDAQKSEVSPEESSSTSQPLEQVQNHDENDVFANVRQHSEQPESINDTYVLEKDDGNVIPDSSNICTNDTKGMQRSQNRVKDYAYHKERFDDGKQAEQSVLLQAEQADWL